MGIRPLIRTERRDPLAIGIINSFYGQIKLKDNGDLSVLESEFVADIENGYYGDKVFGQGETHRLMEQVYDILSQDDDRSEQKEELYALLEEVIVKGSSANEVFRPKFDAIKERIKAIKRLDFSNYDFTDERASRDLISYFYLAIDMAVETMKHSMVSNNVMATLLSKFPNVIVVVTGENGAVRFTNGLGEKLLGMGHDTQIGDHIVEMGDIWKALKKDGSVERMDIHLVSKTGAVPATLEVPAPIRQRVYQVREHTFIISVKDAMDLSLNATDNIRNLDYIIKACERLLGGDGTDPEIWIEGIQKFAWDVRESLQGSVEALVAKKPEGHKLLDIDEMMETVVLDFPDLSIGHNVSLHTEFLADPGDVRTIVHRAIGHLSRHPSLKKVSLDFKEAPFIGIYINIHVEVTGDLDLEAVLDDRELKKRLEMYRGHINVLGDPVLQMVLQHPE